MKYPIWKPLLVVAVLALCLWSLYPPKERLKGGIDLVGGVTLVYDVTVPEGSDQDNAVEAVMSVLRTRVDPNGTKNLVWRQLAGNRFEVQMARASGEVQSRRQTYQEAVDALVTGNLSEAQVEAAIQLPPEQRTARLNALAGGDATLRETLTNLATLRDGLETAQSNATALESQARELDAQIAASPADADPSADVAATPPAADLTNTTNPADPASGDSPAVDRAALVQEREALQARLNTAALAEIAAQEAYTTAKAAALTGNIDPEELERIFEEPDVAFGNETVPLRTALLNQLRQANPGRVPAIDAVVNAYKGYDQVKGRLDDPYDLIREFQKSGVLEFRIAAVNDSNSTGVPPRFEQYVDTLDESGPRAAAGDLWRWFEVEDIYDLVNVDKAKTRITPEEGVRLLQRGGPEGNSTRYVAGYDGGKYYVLLSNDQTQSMTRDMDWELTSVGPSTAQDGTPAVGFTLDSRGATLMSNMTRDNIGRPMAIVLDDRVHSAPITRDELSSQIQVSGQFMPEDITALQQTLMAGSLEASLGSYPASINYFGPQLGQENLSSGLIAAVTSLCIVAVFMVLYYFLPGTIAAFALFANMIIILGVMAVLGATFTLPGIAGIVLTIGMAVDANVLIFERIREELERKVDLKTAVRLGYEKAFSTIIDANITTFITCVVLYYTATADIKGFAITLMVGILASLFTALFCSRVLIDLYLMLAKPKTLNMLPTVSKRIRSFLSPNVNWLGLRKVFYPLSLAMMVIGLVLVATRGRDMLDIEFRSGTEVVFDLKEGQTMERAEVQSRLRTYALVGERLQRDAAATFTDPAQEAAATVLRPALEERAARIQADPVANAAPADLADLDDAVISTRGEISGTAASEYAVATLIQDSQLIEEVVRGAFQDVLATQAEVDFASSSQEDPPRTLVLPVRSASLDEVVRPAGINIAGQPDISAYRGGVAIVLKDLTPAATLDQIRDRILRARNQSRFVDLGYRSQPQVIGVTAAGQSEGEGQSQPTYSSAVVLVSDHDTDYTANPETFTDADGLASTEWDVVRSALGQSGSLASVKQFGSQVSASMRDSAIVAMLLSLLAVVLYIWFRFGSLRYGLAAIAALVHDITITLGALALSGYIAQTFFGPMLYIQDFKLTIAIVAAILTIIGYSLNDTIVVFDRIRENRGRLSYATPGIVNDSINQTISRTVLTSGTTLLAILVLYALGGPGVHPFAFAMLVGVVVGTYSSIAVAAPIMLIGAGRGRAKSAGTSGTPGSSGNSTRDTLVVPAPNEPTTAGV